MALEDLNPAVRVEEILDGADIEPETRLEYFMKKAANEVPKPAGSSDAGKVVTVNEDGDGFELAESGGGSGLPEYTSADKGKVLTIGEGEGSVTTVVVPEQTMAVSDDPSPVVGADSSAFVVGATAVLLAHGERNVGGEYTLTCMEEEEGIKGFVDDRAPLAFFLYEGSVLVRGSEEDTWTFSLTASVPSVEPKWEGVGGYIHNASRTFESGIRGLLQTAVTTLVQNSKTFAEAYGVILSDDDSAAVLEMAQNPTRVNVWHALNQDFVVLRSNDDGNDNGSITVVLPYYEQVVATTLTYFLSITFTMNSNKDCYVRVFVLGKMGSSS